MQIREMQSQSELQEGYSILRELRTTLPLEDFLSIYRAARAANGYQLLRHVEALLHEYKCRGLRLSTGTANEKARRFYEREGWALKSVTYKKFT